MTSDIRWCHYHRIRVALTQCFIQFTTSSLDRVSCFHRSSWWRALWDTLCHTNDGTILRCKPRTAEKWPWIWLNVYDNRGMSWACKRHNPRNRTVGSSSRTNCCEDWLKRGLTENYVVWFCWYILARCVVSFLCCIEAIPTIMLMFLPTAWNKMLKLVYTVQKPHNDLDSLFHAIDEDLYVLVKVCEVGGGSRQ